MADTQSTRETIQRFIFETFPLAQKRRIGEEVSLLETGLVDSIGILEIVAFVEREFMIKVADEDLVPENFGSIAGIASFIGRRLERQMAEGTLCDSR